MSVNGGLVADDFGPTISGIKKNLILKNINYCAELFINNSESSILSSIKYTIFDA